MNSKNGRTKPKRLKKKKRKKEELKKGNISDVIDHRTFDMVTSFVTATL